MRRTFFEALRFFLVQLRARVGGFRCWQCPSCGWGRWEPVWTRELYCEGCEGDELVEEMPGAHFARPCARRPFWDR